MTTVIVTGAAGFIGYHTTLVLLKNNYTVIAIDNLSRGKKGRLDKIEKEGGETIIADIRDKEQMNKIIRRTDSLVHLAALVSVEESYEKPDLYSDINVKGTAILAKASLENSLDKIIYASSAAVYGFPEKIPIKEDHPKNPVSPYGVTKYSGEQIITTVLADSHTKPVILRFFNVYGPGQDPENPYTGVITKFIYRIMRNEPPVIFGDGLQTRDFIHVHDVATSIIKALNYSSSGVFNIGTGKETTITDLAIIINRIMGKDLKPIYTRPRKGDIRRSVADTSMARMKLGFEAQIDIYNGLKQYIRDISI